VLPNGKVILIGGTEEGYSGLGYMPVSMHICRTDEVELLLLLLVTAAPGIWGQGVDV
jgi:hypothetical protein